MLLASLIAQLVKNLPAMQETWVQFLGQKDPLEKEMATHSSTLAWRTPWTEKPGRLQSMGSQESDMTEWLSTVETESRWNQGTVLPEVPIMAWALSEPPSYKVEWA